MVGSVTNGYGANPYAATAATPNPPATTAAAKDEANTAAKAATPSVSVTLSPEAKAALAAQTDTRSTDAVIAAARSALDKLLADAKATSALKDGKPTIDVAGLDRRSLYAIASNANGKFSVEEQVVAALQMKATGEAVLAAPASVMRVTGDYSGLYRSALANLELAGPEERATAQWSQDKAALTEGLKQATDKPGRMPTGIEDDPIAAYLKEIGGVVASPRTRDINAVASDVRTVLDKQYASATKDGAATTPDDGEIDFSKFDSRSLAAVALNKGDQFSEHEIAEAADEVRARSGDTVKNAWASSQGGDASAFGKSLITQYTAMSAEERDAAGWTPALYDRMVALRSLSDKLASMFNGDGGVSGGGGTSLMDFLSA